MPYVKRLEDLNVQTGDEFDALHTPGTTAPLSGLYLCANCRGSVVARRGEPLPAGVHHRHDDDRPVKWRLLVRSHWA